MCCTWVWCNYLKSWEWEQVGQKGAKDVATVASVATAGCGWQLGLASGVMKVLKFVSLLQVGYVIKKKVRNSGKLRSWDLIWLICVATLNKNCILHFFAPTVLCGLYLYACCYVASACKLQCSAVLLVVLANSANTNGGVHLAFLTGTWSAPVAISLPATNSDF